MKEELLVFVRFREAVRVNGLTETYVDVNKHRTVQLSWHPKGVCAKAPGKRMVVVPPANILYTEVEEREIQSEQRNEQSASVAEGGKRKPGRPAKKRGPAGVAGATPTANGGDAPKLDAVG